jgi:DNA transposition AAA+ family ATPase
MMTETPKLYNSVAPLANVALLLGLATRLQDRAPGLPGMGTFYGPAGWGKTTAGIYVTNRLNACHVEALPFGGIRSLLAMIVTELGLRPLRSLDDLFAQASGELARTARPLILDEADHLLSARMIETIRRLHDVSGAPVILMGEELLPQKLMQWERVHSRMLSRVAAQPATLDDVKHLAPIYAPGIEIDDALKAALLAASKHSIRHVSTNLANLREFAQLRGLTRLTAADWGKTAFHSADAPAARRFA